MKWILRSQSIALFAGGLLFPFYIAFLRDVGANFAQFGWAYGIFGLSGALVHRYIGERSDTFGRKPFLLINSWGTAFVLLFFPMVTHIWHLYVLQAFMGALVAMQKTCEKALLADMTEKGTRGRDIGRYHGWTSVWAALAVIAAGYVLDFLTLEAIFYVASALMFVSGFFVLRIKEPHRE